MTSINTAIVDQARTWLGTKYHHQGRLKKSAQCKGGVDCVGLLIGVADELSICDSDGCLLSKHDRTGYSSNPIIPTDLVESHLTQITHKNMQAGDVLLFKFWKEPQHVGILTNYPTGGFGFIHCNASSNAVIEQPLSDTWLRMITHVYRFINYD